jgi:hypothetical protein
LVGIFQRGKMSGGAERVAVQRMVGITEPYQRDGRAACAQDFAAEALGHRLIPVRVMANLERLRRRDRRTPGRKGAGAMVDVTEMLRVEKIGGAR